MSGGVHSLKLLHRVIIKIPNETDRMEVLRGETRRGHLKFSCVNSCGFSDALRAMDSLSPSLHYYVSRCTHATNITLLLVCVCVNAYSSIHITRWTQSFPFSLSNCINKVNLYPSVKKSRRWFYLNSISL